MADPSLPAAIREAEEALHVHDTAHWSVRGHEDNVYPCITALRSLLRALPAEGEAPAPQPAPPAETTPDGHGCPIEGEPGHEGCAICGHPFPDREPAPLEEAVLSREAFLRHLHTIADAPQNKEGLHPSEVAIANHDAALRRRTGLSPEVLAREESEPVHRLLTKRGVAEQLPPFKTSRAPLYVRVLAALTERDAARAALAFENATLNAPLEEAVALANALRRYEPFPRCEYERGCDDSDRTPACRPCEARRALAALTARGMGGARG